MGDIANTAKHNRGTFSGFLVRLKALRRRLKARADTEHEQAILRIVIVSLVLAYMGFTFSPGNTGPGHAEPLLVLGLAAALALAVAIFVGICIWPAPSVQRRVVGMLADGMTETEVLAAYPDLIRQDLQEALRYAAEAVRERALPLLPS